MDIDAAIQRVRAKGWHRPSPDLPSEELTLDHARATALAADMADDYIGEDGRAYADVSIASVPHEINEFVVVVKFWSRYDYEQYQEHLHRGC